MISQYSLSSQLETLRFEKQNKMTTTNNYEVKIISSTETKVEEFKSYESAVTFYQEKCEEFIGEFEEICHNPAQEQQYNAEGNGYKVELNFIN